MRDFYNLEKRGTVIISTYRSGTHFLLDSLCLHLGNTVNLGELDNPEIPQTAAYSVSIINAVVPKIMLVKEQELLKDYHVVCLTRNDKINHWISYYVWRQFNTEQQRFDDSNLPHHGGDKSKYHDLPIQEYDLSQIENWLTEQYIVNLFQSDALIDYDDLSKLESDIRWTPNDYDKTLSQLFTNHKEIENMLKTYKVPHVKK